MDGRVENRIGTRVRAARQRIGWNRETLAFHSGISWSAIAQVEAGRRTNLRPATLESLADALGVTIDYLVAGSRRPAAMFRHRCLVYGSAEEFVDEAAPFLAEGANRHEAVLAVCAESHAELLQQRLGDVAAGVEFAERSEWYRSPAGTLAGYRAFVQERLGTGAVWVRILGEPLLSSCSEVEVRAWMRSEAMLDLAFATEPLTLLCAYDRCRLGDEPMGHVRSAHAGSAPAAGSNHSDPFERALER